MAEETNRKSNCLALVNLQIDLKSPSKAVEKLIDSVGRGLGVLWEPYRIKKLASAHAHSNFHQKLPQPPKSRHQIRACLCSYDQTYNHPDAV